jgi:hypothetical protein
VILSHCSCGVFCQAVHRYVSSSYLRSFLISPVSRHVTHVPQTPTYILSDTLSSPIPSTIATRHYNLDRTYSMSTSMEPETFPLEVWLRILNYSTPAVHRAISQLSSAFHHISRRRLYDTIVFGNQVYLGVTRDTAYGATWCRDLKLFHKLHKGRDDWKPHVRRVYVQCCKSMVCNDVLCEYRLSAAIW